MLGITVNQRKNPMHSQLLHSFQQPFRPTGNFDGQFVNFDRLNL
jgi:hypothetical protein